MIAELLADQLACCGNASGRVSLLYLLARRSSVCLENTVESRLTCGRLWVCRPIERFVGVVARLKLPQNGHL